MSWKPVVALLALAGPTLAQTRPLRTEEAATAPAGRLLLETGVELIRAEPNFLTGKPRDRWDAPIVRLVYSPADTVEVDLEWTARIFARSDPVFGSVSDYGDVALRTKLRFAREKPGRPAIGVRFSVTLPETNSLMGLGPNTIRMRAELLLSKTLGRTSVHANLGGAIEDKPLEPHAQSDFMAYGLALEQRVGERLGLVAEVAGLGLGRGYPGADRHAEARAGFRWHSGRTRWDAALRRGLEAADGSWGFSAGLAWALRGPI
jgi:hypothetical protein